MKEPEAYEEAFLREARAALDDMNAALVRAESQSGHPDSSGDRASLEQVLRAAHTLKGLAGMMRYEGAAGLCHAIEDALAAVQAGRVETNRASDLLFEAFDFLSAALGSVQHGEPEPDPQALIGRLQSLAAGGAAKAAHPGGNGSPAGPPSDFLPVKTERLDRLMNLAEELVVAKLRLDQVRLTVRDAELSAAVDTLGRLTSELQYEASQARLVPVRLIFNRFPRLVRDLAKAQGKEVALVQEGGELEVDRALADELAESLLHLLRNAVDHGIEPGEVRRQRGKPAQGTVRVTAVRTRDSAAIEVSDDGAGIDYDAIRRAAGLPDGAGDEDLRRALFSSGLSTASAATQVSGRGLGLDIVYRKIRSLGGTVKSSSRQGAGTSFRIEVPLALAIVRALICEVAGRSYAIPITAIDRVVAVGESEIGTLASGEALVIESEAVPLARLRGLLKLPPARLARLPVVVLRREGRRVGLAVDALGSTHEIVLKPIARALGRNRPFAGSAILGTGQPILVLDTAAIALPARREASA